MILWFVVFVICFQLLFAGLNILLLNNLRCVIILKIVSSHAHALSFIFCLQDFYLFHFLKVWSFTTRRLIEAFWDMLIIIHNFDGIHDNIRSLAVVDWFVFWSNWLVQNDAFWLLDYTGLLLFARRFACNTVIIKHNALLIIYTLLI